ncbi:MAG: hypothetical protein ACI8S6_003196 [Myxococcota bacterium]|jgi:hypothetical protein
MSTQLSERQEFSWVVDLDAPPPGEDGTPTPLAPLPSEVVEAAAKTAGEPPPPPPKGLRIRHLKEFIWPLLLALGYISVVNGLRWWGA